MGNRREFAIFQDHGGSYYYAPADATTDDRLVRRGIFDPHDAFEMVKRMNEPQQKTL